ncbi:hypothetical protein Pmani_031905 [Petrolisthes manimaculis]|uniref:Coatomer alpha subunit C-terminal domain-containing protein n=1 Tax=Petrolisthes manimaculis TaxID=1843537 RepID=A0AAE1NU45_9EUCA|nr:hypothetical protein Pmani_031905 [Petrolisthes manimaculis]
MLSVDDGDEGWGDDDDGVQDDVSGEGSGQWEEDYFVPSPRGQSVTQGWTQRSQLTIDHILVDSFESVCRLLNDQSCTSYLTLLTLPSLFTYPAPNCLTTANVKEHLSVLSLKLPALMDRLTLTQAGSSYGHTLTHSSWHLLWTDSRCEEREREKEGEKEGEKKGRREEKKDRDRERREEIKV